MVSLCQGVDGALRPSEACPARVGRTTVWPMSTTEPTSGDDAGEETSQGISDDQLPEDLQPTDDNPLAKPPGDDSDGDGDGEGEGGSGAESPTSPDLPDMGEPGAAG